MSNKQQKTYRFRTFSLALAESVDAWRIIPRGILIFFSIFIFVLFAWFKSIPTYVETKCDPATLQTLLKANVEIVEAKAVACTVVGVVGGPTAAQTTFVTAIISLSTAIFGLYTATGRPWNKGMPDDLQPHDASTTIKMPITINTKAKPDENQGDGADSTSNDGPII